MQTTPATTSSTPSSTRVEALIHQHLLLERGFLSGGECMPVEDWPWIDVGEAIARCALAPEHLVGERTIALFTMEQDYPDCFQGFLLFTDRRVVGRYPRINGTHADVHLRYGWIGAAQLTKGMLSQKLTVQHGDQAVELAFGAYDEQLKAFFDALAQIPPAQREPAPRPLCAPSEADPTGARGAAAQLIEPDDQRNAFLLEYIARAHAAGEIPVEIGADLVSRVVLQSRNETFGRGVCDGSWMSPLGRDDLSNVLVALYKNPVRHVEEPDRALTFDVRNKVDKVLDAIDRVDAVLSLDVMGAIGPTGDVNLFTCLMRDTGSFCSFRLLDGNLPLRQRAPDLTEELHAQLDRLEAVMVLRRCAFGWNAPATTLMHTPSSDLIARFASVMGDFDATILGRPQDQRTRKRD